MATSRFRWRAAALAVGCAFIFGGCNTADKIDPMAEAAVNGERPVAMRGRTSYFDNKVAATVTVSRGFSRGVPVEGKGGKGKHRERNAGTMTLEDADATGFEEADETAQRVIYEDMVRVARARRAAGSPMPPVTIRMQLENHGSEPVEVEILELNSDLGNFAVRPTKLKIDPAQLAEVEPVVSQLGVTSDEIPVQVTLRVAGKKEVHVILVKSLFTAKDLESKKK